MRNSIVIGMPQSIVYKHVNTKGMFTWKRQPVRAAGYLLRCNDKFLMIREKKRWSDLGGKCERGDRSPVDTAWREAQEESNGIFPDIRHLEHVCYYNRQSKYLLYVVPVEEEFEVQAPLAWIKAPPRQELHPRLRYHRRRLSIFRIRSAIPYWDS